MQVDLNHRKLTKNCIISCFFPYCWLFPLSIFFFLLCFLSTNKSSFCFVLYHVGISDIFNTHSSDFILHMTLFKGSPLCTCKNNLERVMNYFCMILRVSSPHGPRMRCTLLFFVGVAVTQTVSIKFDWNRFSC